jgi:hypothetical protein
VYVFLLLADERAPLRRGVTHDEVAARLKISSETVEKHRSNILRKLKLQSTAELVRYAHDHGFTLSALSERGGRLLP